MIFPQVSMQQQHQQQQPPVGLHEQSQSPAMAQQMSASPRPSSSVVTARSALPDRNVMADTIEDAYVQFVLYCNPAVPAETDTSGLREAFRIPPKSGGKTFSTFTLFQLIRQLEVKEIKTWAELALKLGVEPPDQDKGQSSQKIQQYAVRLKRWMHSMHVDAFFEYLMDHPHPYWTEIPTDPTPVCETGRDGVLAEDDMALRALLPEIRPRRGRKRPDEDDLAKSPLQRARLDSPSTGDGYRGDSLGPWSAHVDGRSTYGGSDTLKQGATTASTSGWLPAPDPTQTPLSAYPQGSMSAITPSTNRTAFWADSEPKSAVTPLRSKASHRRHGAKVVSSAWRSSALGASGRARGRPPLNKTNTDGPFVAFPVEGSACNPSPESKSIQTPITPEASITQSTPPAVAPDHQPPLPRPAKPSISLQVPERHGGSVRLATPPPPVVIVNGNITDAGNLTATAPPVDVPLEPPPKPPVCLQAQQTTPDVPPPRKGNGPAPQPNDIPIGMFENMEDRTNIEAVLGYFIHETANGEWVDSENNPIEGCSMAEAYALVHTTIERMWQTAANEDAFMINLAVLAGGRALMNTSKLKIKREVEYEDRAIYSCSWQFRMGNIRGNYNMVQTVMYNRWKKTEEEKKTDKPVEKTTIGGGTTPESDWETRYRDLLRVSELRDRELQELRAGVLSSLNQTFTDAKELGEQERP
ncbi:ARS binding protein 2 [Colletotrichum truncatum]|uniref:ARS binding protein 2 n=1 Tax=Colletotrichum truncatum TaxID=5467 RepID=A0ACC3ZAB3_COLTU|nr:ARS binding protein 2 [Colletotrichum truncatum]KAF6796183.1 ARS binding protein 2 [Colletotrichum truncatum]